ncbi:hypothetical protein BU25DRAFT_481854 [Macroventuria anomochaeta]|uniref:Uncharacterized protein n=1 Tax=Macroventuria anomochaeta TaxID=301207 RepID=A0ACB6SD58_9PLEO|nr:uncharacterized protein BU25DRAFT_481854 [Macroventuria anomochaeta]KAF2631268.1 hypothetical protein BU25DRAFT_481854 [Macroventuria anomochaeta]
MVENSRVVTCGFFVRVNPNGGVSCTNICKGQGYKFAGTNDNQCWCNKVINRNNSATAGILSPAGIASCQGGCRGNPNANEGCRAIEWFISIYEFTVSGFLRNACVPMLLLLCFLYVISAGSGERPSARCRRELVGTRLKRWRYTSGRGGAGDALMSGPRRLEPLLSVLGIYRVDTGTIRRFHTNTPRTYRQNDHPSSSNNISSPSMSHFSFHISSPIFQVP